MKLEGRVAIITGAARGVAKGVASAFLKAGARVLIVDREGATGHATQVELGEHGEVDFLEFDLTEHSRLRYIVERALERFGRIDILVNAAQAAKTLLLVDSDDAAMHLPFDTGFWPTFGLMRAAHPHLVHTRGCVINFGSGSGFAAPPTQGAYAAAKEAIRAITRVAAAEWGPSGVRVNLICPFADSPGVQAWAAHAPADFAAQIAKVPLQRIGDCEADIGAAAVFLASDDARYITGHSLMVDGGQTRPF